MILDWIFLIIFATFMLVSIILIVYNSIQLLKLIVFLEETDYKKTSLKEWKEFKKRK